MYLEFPRPRAIDRPVAGQRRRLIRLVLIPIGVLLLAVGVLVASAVIYPRWAYTANMKGAMNQRAAVTTLRNVVGAQDSFRQSKAADLDGDGIGEYGAFGELCAGIPVRGGTARIDPPVLSGTFRSVQLGGAVSRSGFYFRIYLPAAKGVAGPETAGGKLIGPAPDPDAAESRWCAYAWPVQQGNSGFGAFFVSEAGVVLQTDSARYSGWNGPMPGAAFRGGAIDDLRGAPAIDGTGNDGALWKRVEE